MYASLFIQSFDKTDGNMLELMKKLSDNKLDQQYIVRVGFFANWKKCENIQN